MQRRNWDGRSGEPLKPLGRLIRLVDEVVPVCSSWMVTGSSILKGTSFGTDVIAINQRLDDVDVDITETGRSISNGLLSRYADHS